HARHERPLDLDRGGGGCGRVGEDAEELVAAAVDLLSARPGDRIVLELARLGENAGVLGAETLGQTAGILQVAEEERQHQARPTVTRLANRTGSSAWTTVPWPGGLSSVSSPSRASTRSRSPRSPDPRSAEAPPVPSSATSTTIRPPSHTTRT